MRSFRDDSRRLSAAFTSAGGPSITILSLSSKNSMCTLNGECNIYNKYYKVTTTKGNLMNHLLISKNSHYPFKNNKFEKKVLILGESKNLVQKANSLLQTC